LPPDEDEEGSQDTSEADARPNQSGVPGEKTLAG